MEQQVRKPEAQEKVRRCWEKPAFTVLEFKETATFRGPNPEAPTIDRS
jgi:hypothetical protein